MKRSEGFRALGDRELAQLLKAAIGGGQRAVIWEQGGDEALVHLESLRVCTERDLLSISVDLESDQTGRSACTVRYTLVGSKHAPALVGSTPPLPEGNAALVARWGAVLADTLWAALLKLLLAEANRHGEAPRGFVVREGAVRFFIGARPQLDEAARPKGAP